MAHKVHYGPNLPIVYRLVGPGANKSAWKVQIFSNSFVYLDKFDKNTF